MLLSLEYNMATVSTVSVQEHFGPALPRKKRKKKNTIRLFSPVRQVYRAASKSPSVGITQPEHGHSLTAGSKEDRTSTIVKDRVR